MVAVISYFRPRYAKGGGGGAAAVQGVSNQCVSVDWEPEPLHHNLSSNRHGFGCLRSREEGMLNGTVTDP